MVEYNGGCLCKDTAYTARSEPINPHLCSCAMCQKSSRSLTVPWVSFSLENFQWNPDNQLGMYRSSEKTQRVFCKKCGSFLGAIDDGGDSICVTIASLDHPAEIIPGKQHSYEKEAPSWWVLHVKQKDNMVGDLK